MKTPAQQLNTFLAKHDPAIAREAKLVLAKMRKLTPGAIEMVYDNYNALVIGFVPNERPSDAILSIAVRPQWVSICFLQGAGLPDPEKRLKGSGNIARHIRLDSVKDLDDPVVLNLIDIALASARVKLNRKQKRKLVIKSISAKQRPRRVAKAKAPTAPRKHATEGRG